MADRIEVHITALTLARLLAGEIAQARARLKCSARYRRADYVTPDGSLVLAWEEVATVPSKPGPKLSKDGPG